MTKAAESTGSPGRAGSRSPGLPRDYAELKARAEDQNVTWDVMTTAAPVSMSTPPLTDGPPRT
jgi:hypothetical protein